MTVEPQLQLNSSESQLVKKFLTKQRDPGFAKIAEILADKGCLNEAICLLKQGLLDFPMLTSARLQLAKSLFLRGLIPEAQAEIQSLEVSQPKNISLLKLKLKIAVLLETQDLAQVILKALAGLVPDDEFVRKCRLGVAMGEFSSAKSILVNDSSYLQSMIKNKETVAAPLAGALEQTIALLKNGLQTTEQKTAFGKDSGDDLTQIRLLGVNSFVPLPAAAAVQMQVEVPEDPKLLFLNKLLMGLERLD
jgi:uncharacterized protein YehS (DUF1456 family)